MKGAILFAAIVLVIALWYASGETVNLSKAQIEARVRVIAGQFGVSPALMAGIIEIESAHTWNPRTFNGGPGDRERGGAYGLSGMTLQTARDLGYTGTPEGLYDVDTNLTLQAQLLHSFWNVLEDERDKIARYNSGKSFANAPTSTKDVYYPAVQRHVAAYRAKGWA